MGLRVGFKTNFKNVMFFNITKVVRNYGERICHCHFSSSEDIKKLKFGSKHILSRVCTPNSTPTLYIIAITFYCLFALSSFLKSHITNLTLKIRVLSSRSII